MPSGSVLPTGAIGNHEGREGDAQRDEGYSGTDVRVRSKHKQPTSDGRRVDWKVCTVPRPGRPGPSALTRLRYAPFRYASGTLPPATPCPIGARAEAGSRHGWRRAPCHHDARAALTRPPRPAGEQRGAFARAARPPPAGRAEVRHGTARAKRVEPLRTEDRSP